MTEKKNYPEEIYTEKMNQSGVWTCRLPDIADIEKAYDIGLAHGKEQATKADPLAGFSNLTQAIQDGVRIDWERLEGRMAKCVHPEMGSLAKKLVRNHHWGIDEVAAWYERHDILWGGVLERAWLGTAGWQLWIEGEIPVKTPTPDELELGTGFRGEYLNGVCYDYIIYLARDGRKRAICLSTGVRLDPAEIEVIEVYGVGTFQAPKEEA